jgi:putative FmdB family regulatory protein
MPIYAYKCASCGHAKDVLQKMTDPQLTVCPACGAATFNKQLTAAGFQLKGSGWYATDFKGPVAPAPAADGESAKAPAEGAKPATDGAAKPATETAAKPAVAPAAAPASAPATRDAPKAAAGGGPSRDRH